MRKIKYYFIAAACVVVPILSYRFGMRDTLLSFTASISQLFYGVLMGTAPESWVFYLGMYTSDESI